MKNLRILFVCLMIFAGINCSKQVDDLPIDPPIAKRITLKEAIAKANSACGFANPDESLQWLKDIIVKGEEDIETMKHMGNYKGIIYSTTYQNKPVFYIRMAMGSGGLAVYIFDCTGTRVTISPNDVLAFSLEAQKGVLIYSNVLT